MSWMDKVKNTFSQDDREYDEYDEYYEDEVEGARESSFAPKASVSRPSYNTSAQSLGQMQIIIVNPESYETEAKTIGEHLRAKKPVIMNCEETNEREETRLVDFISGAVYSLNGSLRKISQHIYLITPANVAVTEQKEAVAVNVPGSGNMSWQEPMR